MNEWMNEWVLACNSKDILLKCTCQQFDSTMQLYNTINTISQQHNTQNKANMKHVRILTHTFTYWITVVTDMT